MIRQINSYRKDTLVYEVNNLPTNNDLIRIKNAILHKEKMHESVNLFFRINSKDSLILRYLEKFKMDLNKIDIINKVVYITKRNSSKISNNSIAIFAEKYFNEKEVNKAWKWVESE
ncbi:STAS/SEC14 domain-containing protein [Aureivirga sp. CE67]|uniref:STAS/SEC14 domain-containing protein n=1 Tax=Aureivirga sp. CE67 TaxID=1788983 RepID=UPI0018CA2B50|nr:STAS/SEC14 domain-containing protein [Aureivirga sp. CE67]